jgi:hypothetical protein
MPVTVCMGSSTDPVSVRNSEYTNPGYARLEGVHIRDFLIAAGIVAPAGGRRHAGRVQRYASGTKDSKIM